MLIIFTLFESLIKIFGSRIIHIGCDEAKTYSKFPQLIDMVANWCAQRNLQFMVWDDVVSKINIIPPNMIVQRWRHYTSGKMKSLNIPYVLSEGYYLDKCEDPIYIYNKNKNPYGGNLQGYIACVWTELIDNNTFYDTIVPTIYLLSQKWNSDEDQRLRLPELLHDMCLTHGYPQHNKSTWKTRRWDNFFDKSRPRSIANVDTDMALTREEDLYPVFSEFLIELLYELYVCCKYILDLRTCPNNILLIKRKEYLRISFCHWYNVSIFVQSYLVELY